MSDTPNIATEPPSEIAQIFRGIGLQLLTKPLRVFMFVDSSLNKLIATQKSGSPGFVFRKFPFGLKTSKAMYFSNNIVESAY